AGDARIRRELELAGKPTASAADEADHGEILARPPEDFTGLSLGEIRKTAAGLGAVRVALGYAIDEMGAADGMRMLLKLNQPDGLDCQSCAWPDPDPKHRSSFAEYCENGAKVTAEENTRRLIPDDFFRKHSVAELSRRSDY